MKLRIRYKSKTSQIEVENCTVFSYLHSIVELAFQLRGSVTLSLNNKTPLEGHSQQTLSDIGIVSGDLIYVMPTCGSKDVSVAAPSHLLADTDNSVLAAAHVEDGETVWKVESKAGCDIADDLMAGEQMFPWTPSNKMDAQSPQAESYMSLMDSPCNSESASHTLLTDTMPLSHGLASGMNIDVKHLSDLSNTDDEMKAVQVNRYLNEPMNVCESTVNHLPESLVTAFTLVQPQSCNAALLVAINVLMSELGYQLHVNESGVDWHLKAGTLRLNYTYQLLRAVEFQLQCVPMHNSLIVHGFVHLADGSVTRTRLSLVASAYINNSITSDAVSSYKGSCLGQLSRLFKDAIAYPMLQTYFRATNEAIIPALDTIFYELKLNILKFLDARSLCRVASVNRLLHDIALEPVLWRRLYIVDFTRENDMSLKKDWANKYRDKYVDKKRRRQEMQEAVQLMVEQRIRPMIPFAPRAGPGFLIGGEYDLYPSFPRGSLSVASNQLSANVLPTLGPRATGRYAFNNSFI